MSVRGIPPMKFLLFGGCALVFLFFLVPQSVFANEIYVVDIQEVISKSHAGSAIRKRVEKEAMKRKARLERLTQEVKDFETKLVKQATLLSDDALASKQDELLEKKRALSRKVQDEKEFLQREGEKAVTQLVDRIQKVIPQVVPEGDDAVVMKKDRRIVMHVAPKYDLTEKVIEKMNGMSVSF
jgi:Skp family chaperone for outer membrane proteins